MGGIHCGYWTRVEAGVTYAKDAGAHYKWGYGGWKLTGVVEASHARSVGVEVGYWADALLAFGMNMGYYSDFTHSEIVLRPEIGLGAMGVRLVYGYNLLPTLRGVGRHELSLIGYLPVIDLGVASGGY
ncbi:MAG: Leucinerich repeat containing protein [Chlorobi bacterium]|nr:Leucinerich repeat containing protein [Chlorobiota bacterium]